MAVLAVYLSTRFVHTATNEHPTRADLAVIEAVTFCAMLLRSACNLSEAKQLMLLLLVGHTVKMVS